MRYNSKYDRYIDDDLVIYRWSKTLDKLVQVKPTVDKDGYLRLNIKNTTVSVHRLVYETFIGEIPDGYEIDHINNIRNDNRLSNLRCVTHTENMNNPISLKNRKGLLKGKVWSGFGEKFKEHYGITRKDNIKLYDKERRWCIKHNKKCRWEE